MENEPDQVMSPDFNANVFLKNGLSIGSTIKMRLEHVKVQYYENHIVVNELYEIPTKDVDKIVRDAGKRSSRSRKSKKPKDEDSKSLNEYM